SPVLVSDDSSAKASSPNPDEVATRNGLNVHSTAPGEPWEQVVTDCLMALCCRDADQPVEDALTSLTNTYLTHDAKAGMTVLDVRLGLTVLDTVGSAEHPGACRLSLAFMQLCCL
ncbi:hypothetical protein ACWC09_52560, partial [Streptomyces sp. NPDC001617]